MTFWDEFIASFEDTGSMFAIALGILVAGWIVARLAQRVLLIIFKRTNLDDRLALWLKQDDLDVFNQRIARLFYILLRILSLAFFLIYAYNIPPVKMLADATAEFFSYLATLGVVIFLFNLLVLGLITWVMVRLLRQVNISFEKFCLVIDGWRETRIKSIKIQRLELLTADRLTDGLIVVARNLRIIVNIVLGLIYLAIVFSFFPPTQDLVRGLVDGIWKAVTEGWLGFVAYLPNLLNLILIFFLGRYLLRFLHFLSNEVGKGNITMGSFYPEWAEPTYQLVRILLVALMLVVAFPFLPGSSSPAFQGLSIFFGFLFTMGSSSVVANIMAGIVLTYTRAFKIGDRVKIADTIGDVIERTLLVTRIKTIKNVDITVPNGMVLSSHIINYSSSAGQTGLILHTTVTIGYDVPWPKVHETLIEASLATEHIMDKPKPFVFQTSLDDFYVSYEINAYTDVPRQMADIYSDLHKNIQDKCNQAGIEIMSPHYAAVRDGHISTIPNEYLPKDYSPPGFRVERDK